jgi:hypothetical protein
MLSELDFAAWAKRIGLSDPAQSAIAPLLSKIAPMVFAV